MSQKKENRTIPPNITKSFERDLKRSMEPFFKTQKQISSYIEHSGIHQLQKEIRRMHDSGPFKQIAEEQKKVAEMFKNIAPYSFTANDYVHTPPTPTRTIDDELLEKVTTEVADSVRKELETGSVEDKQERVTLHYSSEGDIYRDSISSAHKTKVKSKQYVALLNLLISNQMYIPTSEIADSTGYKNERAVQTGIATFRKKLVNDLKLPIDRPIQGGQGQGYRIHPAVKLIKIEGSKKS